VKVHPFTNRALIDANANLDRLVARARTSKVLGDVAFDAAVWDLLPVKPARPSASSARHAKLYFTTHDGGTTKGVDGRTPLAPRFAAFLKALLISREQTRKRVAKDHDRLLRAARHLHEAMSDPGKDPCHFRSADFVAACAAIATRKTQRGTAAAKTTAYRLGQGLEEIAAFVNRHDLCSVRIAFANPFRRVEYDNTRVSEEARQERAARMASDEEIGALIDASVVVRQGRDEADTLQMAVCELLVCAPVRINELLYMRADCRRTERSRRTGSREEVAYLGYAYEGSKGASDSTKWIPSSMVPVADRALEDVKRITEPYRRIALWMEDHPGRAYVADPWRSADPETLLTHAEVGLALGLATLSEHRWLEVNGLRKRDGVRSRYRLGDIEAAILRRQPKLPDPRARLSDFMFVIPKHFLRNDSATQNYALTFLTDAQIGVFLGCKKGSVGIFERLKILDPDGRAYRINTHKVRHYLNTAAQNGKLSQLDIARWSGRADVRENAKYDHSGGRHLGERLQEIVKTGAMVGPVAETVRALPPVDLEDFVKARFATAHTTDIGMCVQDWSIAPCPSHGACAGCGEHVVVKGNEKHRRRAEQLLQEHQYMLERARQEAEDGTFGAGPWVAHTEKMVAALRKVVAVHEDGTIADGSVVQA
jgi:hypothetical protein